MPFGKMKIFGNQQVMQQQNQIFQPLAAPGQFGGGNYTQMLDQRLQRFLPMMGGQGGLPMPQGLGQIMNGLGGGLGGGMPRGNPVWGAGPQHPMPPAQVYPLQEHTPQGYNQGYGVQMPVQPAYSSDGKFVKAA